MMSGSNSETLFSFELLVKNVRLEKNSQVYHQLALGVRLLDFPMLLINQSQQGRMNPPQQKSEDEVEEYAFNKGKCCFFKMNLNSLHVHLCNTPLYAMVLDMSEITPRFVGSFLISLAKAMDGIKLDGSTQENHSTSCVRQWGLFDLSDSTGEIIGSVSLNYKLVCLGASLTPRFTETSVPDGTDMFDGHQGENNNKINELVTSLPFGSPTTDSTELHSQTGDLSGFDISLKEVKDGESVGVSAERRFKKDLTGFCPPHLYYSNTAQERSVNKGNYKMQKLKLEAFPWDDCSSSNEEDKEEVKGSKSKPANQTAAQTLHLPNNQDANNITPNVLTDALRKLPLLNALVNELSQLNMKNPDQCSTLHPSQASPGPAIPSQPEQTPTLHKPKQQSDFKMHLKPPRYCSTPIPKPLSVKMKEQRMDGSKDASKLSRRKLVFGTTKTFNLRLEQISGLVVKRRECTELIQSKNLPQMDKAKVKSSGKRMKRIKKKSVRNQSLNLNENVETVMERLGMDSAMQETITLKPVSQRCIYVPTLDNENVSLSEDKKDQSEPESERYSHVSDSSQRSQKFSLSDSIIEGHMGTEYADDFDSLESGDACSPDPISSPEPSRAKTPVFSDLCTSSTSEGIKKKPTPSVPVEESRAPQRSLINTHTIRPRSSASAISFCSDDDIECGGRTSGQSVYSGKQAGNNNVQQSSSENFLSSLSEGSQSIRNAMRGLSAESVSSLDAQELEELEDELESLDFRKDYKHISELVASKLPGYTM